MNYLRIYNNIIYTNQQRTLPKEQYKERHHFIPRCMNGPDYAWNIVYLTAKEHFVCHHLLTKIYPRNKKLLFAFWIMCTANKQSPATRNKFNFTEKCKISSIIYEQIRHSISSIRKNTILTPERKRKMSHAVSLALKGIPKTTEHKNKISKTLTGVKHDKARILKKHGKNNPNYIGNYITPAGIFDSSSDAATANNIKWTVTLRRLCKRNANGYYLKKISNAAQQDPVAKH